jgi:hypothetical protein
MEKLIKFSLATFTVIRGELITLWLYKENNKLRDWKNIFTYSPLSSTCLWLRCSNFFNPSKKNYFECAANIKIGNRKSQRLIRTTTYISLEWHSNHHQRKMACQVQKALDAWIGQAGPIPRHPNLWPLLRATSSYGDMWKNRNTNLRCHSPFESEFHRP